MLNKLNELRKGKEEGFTLIELLVVILIIGVLSAIALPIFLNQQKESLKASVKSDVRNTVTQVATWIVSNPSADGAAIATAGSSAATTPAGSYRIVQSNGGTVTVEQNTTESSAYDVVGVNAAISATYSYTFDSNTGKYTEVQ